MSFAMIFSIIIIIAILGVAIYVINTFLGLQKCTEQSLFYDELQKEVDRVWNSERTVTTFTGRLPRGVDSVCFGNSDSVNPAYREEYEVFRRYFRVDANLFLYPPEQACDPEYLTLEHASFEELGGFTCFEADGREVKIGIEKGSFDPLVRIVKNE